MKYLIVNNLSKSFRNTKVIEDVTFTVDKGKIVAITGENGSGKTTLMKLITGWIKPDNGTISITQRFGFCPQEPLLFPRLTVKENIDYFLTAYGREYPDSGKNKKGAEWLMKEFAFAEHQDKKASVLSGGTKQKLNLVLSLLHDPDLMILDEPYASLDWETYLRFWDYAAARKKEGKSILIVSHFIYDQSYIDELYLIRNHRMECVSCLL